MERRPLMTTRLVLRCFIIASILIGLAAWVLLPSLFSLLIILALSYLDEHFIEALQAKTDYVSQLKEARDQNRCMIADSAFPDVLEAVTVKVQ
jgi:hypothetical protein